MGKSNWKPEDYSDFNIVPKLVKRACDLCRHKDRKIPKDKANDCHRCIESGWAVKKKFKAAGKAKASVPKTSPEENWLKAQELRKDPAALIEFLHTLKVPALAQLAKHLDIKVPFGSKRDVFVKEIVGGVI
jgi:hypothetical protein